VLAWAAVPMAAGIAPGSYLTTVGAKSIAARLLTGVAFAYAVVLAFWAVSRLTSQSKTVERSVEQLAAHPERATTPVCGPMAYAAGFTPILAISITNPVRLLLDLDLFLLGVLVFFGCLEGLHRQPLAARRNGPPTASARPDRRHRGERGHPRPDRHHLPVHPDPLGAVEAVGRQFSP
jgi:hypothetical protein